MSVMRCGIIVLSAVFCVGSLAGADSRRKVLLPQPAAGSSLAVVVDEAPLVHTMQVLAWSPEGTVDSALSGEAQVARAWENLSGLLTAAQSHVGQIVKLNVVVTKPETTGFVQKLLAKAYAEGDFPAVSFVTTPLPEPAALVGFDAVAISARTEAEAVRIKEGLAPVHLSEARSVLLPAGPRVYISGQAEKGDGTVAGATAKTLESLNATLQHLKLGPKDVIQLKAFVTPMSGAAEVRKAIQAFFAPAAPPPVILVEWKSTLPIEIELIAASPKLPAGVEAPRVEFITPPGVASSPVFARVTRVTSPQWIYTSNLYSDKPDLAAEAETRQLFNQLGVVLKPARGDLLNLVKATYYVSDDETSNVLNKVRPDFYHPERPPAASKALVNGVGITGRRVTLDIIAVPAQ